MADDAEKQDPQECKIRVPLTSSRYSAVAKGDVRRRHGQNKIADGQKSEELERTRGKDKIVSNEDSKGGIEKLENPEIRTHDGDLTRQGDLGVSESTKVECKEDLPQNQNPAESRGTRDGARTLKTDREKREEEWAISISRTKEDELSFDRTQAEVGIVRPEEERSSPNKESRKTRNEWRKRMLEEQRIRAEQRKLDEDMKRWREEETLRREMEDKSKITAIERFKLDNQRRQVDAIMQITQEITRNSPLDEMEINLEGANLNERPLRKSGELRLVKENETKAIESTGRVDFTEKKVHSTADHTDSEEDEDWHILVKLKKEQKRKEVPQQAGARDFEKQATYIRIPDYYSAKLPDEEFCITQILQPKEEADKKRAARLERAMREKDKRSMNLDHQIYNLVSKSTKMPTNLDNEMQKILEKVRATTAREGELMEELLQSKETNEVRKQGRTNLTIHRTRKYERIGRREDRQPRRGHESGLTYLLDKFDDDKKTLSPLKGVVPVKAFKKDAPKPNNDSPLNRSYGGSYAKLLRRPRRVLEPIPFLKFDGSPCIQNNNPYKVKQVSRK